jgi:hypothetical protein
MNLVRSGLIFGLVVWAAGTAAFVPLGRFVFGPDNRVPVALSATLIVFATFAGVFAFALRAFAREPQPDFEKGALLGVCACVPGLVLDGALYAFNFGRYPGLDAPASGAMSAGLLFAYAAALLAALGAAQVRAQRSPFSRNSP